jgi:hypothetical protein
MTTDGKIVVTEFLKATGESRPKEISVEDLEKLFSGVLPETEVEDNHDGTFTHEFTPGGPPPPNPAITPDEFAEMYREQLRMITPAEFQQRMLGMPNWQPVAMPSGSFLERPPEVVPDSKPNVWERLMTWLTETQTRTIEVARPRQSYSSAYCTPSRNRITGSPRRGGRQWGGFMGVMHEDYDRMIREGSMVPGVDISRDAGSSAAALRSETGHFNGVRIVQSMPAPQEAEERWVTAIRLGAL